MLRLETTEIMPVARVCTRFLCLYLSCLHFSCPFGIPSSPPKSVFTSSDMREREREIERERQTERQKEEREERGERENVFVLTVWGFLRSRGYELVLEMFQET